MMWAKAMHRSEMQKDFEKRDSGKQEGGNVEFNIITFYV